MAKIITDFLLGAGAFFSSVFSLTSPQPTPQVTPTQEFIEEIQILPESERKTLADLHKKTNGNLVFTISPKTTKLTSLTALGNTIPIEAKEPQGDSSEALARRFITDYGNLFGITSQEEIEYLETTGELAQFFEAITPRTIKLQSFNPNAVAHVKFRQIYQDLPVYSSSLIIHIKANQEVSAVSANFLPIAGLATSPSIQASQAQTSATQFILSKYNNLNQNALEIAQPALIVLDTSLFSLTVNPLPTLSYLVNITSQNPPVAEEIFINAEDASTIGSLSQITRLTREIFNCDNNPDCPSFPGSPSAEENKTPKDLPSEKVYNFLGTVHNYFKNTHNRDGANGQGGTGKGAILKDYFLDPAKTFGFANSGTPDGSSYSDGWSINIAPGQFAIDVVAHEFVHLIKSFNYIQQGSSVSEAIADILGNDVERADWTLDQENKTIRNMADPTQGILPQPDRLFSENYYCSFTANVGSHHNNGVLNKTAYLIAQGGSFNGCTLTGIGREKMAKLIYATFTDYLGQEANFRNFYDGMLANCNDSYGAGSSECQQTTKAMQATEIDQQLSSTAWSSSCPQLCVKQTGNNFEECPAGTPGCECIEKVEYHKPLCATGSISITPTPTTILTPASTPSATPYFTLTPTPTPSPKTTTTPIPESTTLQVDWVSEGQGRCWSSWAAPNCSLQNHQGQAGLALRDLDHDGNVDIICSEGGSESSTTIENISGKTFTISCERYTCNACTTSSSGSHAQCDGGNYPQAQKVSETIELTPGCEAICTPQGAYGSCTTNGSLPQSQNPPGQNPTSTPSPTTNPEPAEGQPTPLITDLLSQVSQTSIEGLLKNLVDDDEIAGFDEQQTRYTGTQGYATEFNYVKNYLENLGLSVETQEFNGTGSCPNTNMKNLIVKIPGKKTNEPYLLTAHLDSTSDSAQKDPAPGADDNASGSVALIEIARTLKNLPNEPDHPIELVLFDAEEVGWCGSTYYVENLPAEKKIQGVINLDMIGNKSGNSPASPAGGCVNFYFENYTGANLLSEKLVNAINTYGIDLVSQSQARDIPSDQKSFTYKQIPAIVGSECTLTTVIHTENDKIEYLNLEQITAAAKTVLAGLLELTMPQPTTNNSQPTTIPSPTPSPTANDQQPTTNLPPMILYDLLSTEISGTNPYIYGWLTDTYLQGKNFDQEITRQINDLKNITSPSHKMILVSSLATLDRLLESASLLKDAGISILGYNTESAVGTPSIEMENLLSTSNNPVATFAQKANAAGFQSIWGPTRPIATNFANNSTLIKQLADSGLDGFVFQEQKYIENQDYAQRALVVKEDIAKINQAVQKDLHLSVQIMPSRCGSSPWTNCKNFVTEIKNDIDSLAIWPAGESNSLLAQFYLTMTQSLAQNTPNLEKDTLVLFNAERTANGVQALIWDDRLSTAARDHARDQSEHGLLGHTGSDGSTLNDRLTRVSYRFTTTAGENIGLGDSTAQGALTSTKSSPAHYQNLLSASFRNAGVGWFIDPNNAQNNRWVLVLAD